MNQKNIELTKDYWEKNIEGFSGFYDTQSEENISAPSWFSPFYKKIIFPVEKKYMQHRYDFVCSYIDKNVKKGMKVSDIGCGSGVFTKRMIEKGAFVFAVDYTETATNLTKKNLSPAESKSCEILLLDITKAEIPPVDLAISIGVLTYIGGANDFFKHILPNTNLFLFNYLSKNNFLNRLRKNISLLDVRNYSYHSFQSIEKSLQSFDFAVENRKKLATGFIIESKKNSRH